MLLYIIDEYRKFLLLTLCCKFVKNVPFESRVQNLNKEIFFKH